jgi:hypothetical protein
VSGEVIDIDLDSNAEERARFQHEFNMTHDASYREAHKREQRQKEIEEYGIDED